MITPLGGNTLLATHRSSLRRHQAAERSHIVYVFQMLHHIDQAVRMVRWQVTATVLPTATEFLHMRSVA